MSVLVEALLGLLAFMSMLTAAGVLAFTYIASRCLRQNKTKFSDDDNLLDALIELYNERKIARWASRFWITVYILASLGFGDISTTFVKTVLLGLGSTMAISYCIKHITSRQAGKAFVQEYLAK